MHSLQEIPLDSRFAPFPTTCWSSIERAATTGGSSVEETADFMRRYWRPIYSFLRRRYDRQEAEDLTQAFFAKFMERDWLARADRNQGRLRTFLITLLKRFVRDLTERRQERFERQVVGWEMLRGQDGSGFEPGDSMTPEDAFERAWTRDLCERAWERLVLDCQREGHDLWPRALRAWFSAAEEGRPSYSALATDLGVTENQLRNALERGKRLYRSCLEDEVRDTLSQPDLAAMSDELRDLLAMGLPQ